MSDPVNLIPDKSWNIIILNTVHFHAIKIQRVKCIMKEENINHILYL